MMNYYVYLALARGRSNALLREAEAAGRVRQARLYRRRAGASGPSDASGSPHRRLLRRMRPAWAGWVTPAAWPRRAGRTAGRRVVLRDGSKVVIRQVHRDDAPLLADGFARLSPRSRRLRFLYTKNELTPAELRYLTDIDHHHHEALGALDRPGGRGVGIARYVRDAGDPHTADIAVTVTDEWQGRGLGTALLAQLARRARAEGIHRFTAHVSAENDAAAGLMRGASAGVVHREHGVVQYEIELMPSEEPCGGPLAPLPC